MKEFYENLKERREEKGLSLQDLHNRTRLSLDYLAAIEAGDIDKLPDGYQRIYLRRYAKELGLDDNEVIRDFDLLTGKLTPAEVNASSAAAASKQKTRSAGSPGPLIPPQIRSFVQNMNLDRIHSAFWIGLAALVILISGYFTWQKYIFEKNNQEITIREISISELIDDLQEKDSVLTPQMPTNSILRTEQSPKLTVVLIAVERTWVREIRDEQDTTEYILPTGIRRSIEARDKVKLRLGRADGIEVWLNGKNLGTMGQENEVVLNLVITNEGIAEKRLRRVVKRDEPDPSAVLEATPRTLPIRQMPRN